MSTGLDVLKETKTYMHDLLVSGSTIVLEDVVVSCSGGRNQLLSNGLLDLVSEGIHIT